MGDSVVWNAEGSGFNPPTRVLADRLVTEGYRSYVTGWIGATIPYTYTDLWPSVPDPGQADVLVVALGANDVEYGKDWSASASVLHTWLDSVDACVVLVGVNEGTTWRGLNVYAAGFNSMLRDEAARHAHAFFVPWAPTAAMMLNGDDVHLNAAGSEAYRQTIIDAVGRCELAVTR